MKCRWPIARRYGEGFVYLPVECLIHLPASTSLSELIVQEGYGDYFKARGKGHAVPVANITDLGTKGLGMNTLLSTVHDLYKNGEALWLANTGTLDHKMNNTDDYVKDTKFQLYAHNTMQ